ncbi:MAG TPA: EAL domain-containing protein [Gammaproteobacteria bacterium]|nr:EAL domain-containing protein [Gammaproteobacteria bacterium]
MFKLSRYFSIASIVGTGVILVALVLLYRQLAMEELIAQQRSAHAGYAGIVSESIWPDYAAFVKATGHSPFGDFNTQPQYAALAAAARDRLRALGLARIDILNPSGWVVFSTAGEAAGTRLSDRHGWQRALGGQSAVDFTTDQAARDIIASYFPLRSHNTDEPAAVLVLSSDVTPLTRRIHTAQLRMGAGVLLVTSLLYLVLLSIVRRAERIIVRQEKIHREHRAQLRHQNNHDVLTGLPNRTHFSERLGESVKRARRARSDFGVLCLDLDRFKLINDSLGHDQGDLLLKIVARRLGNAIRESDLAFRLGGDEFAVILENLGEAESAAVVAQRIVSCLADPIELAGQELIVTASIGIAIFPRDDMNPVKLVKNAEAAMYRAKQWGGRRYEFYTQDLNESAAQRLSFETALQRALSQNEFELYYQPKVACDDKKVVGIEALLRWQRPGTGTVPPADFIPFLEESGLIIPVGEWVLRTACRQNRAWQEQGIAPVRISVNVSTRQFRSTSFVTCVESALKESGLAPKYLELELTESLLVDNAEQAIHIMEKLKALGVTLSIDDFGTGYSSLSCLKHFPVDYLKVDRSFISGLARDGKDAVIASAIAVLARDLELRLVAEGVEDHKQVKYLREYGYDELQGFLFSHPLPADELARFLEKGLAKTPLTLIYGNSDDAQSA